MTSSTLEQFDAATVVLAKRLLGEARDQLERRTALGRGLAVSLAQDAVELLLSIQAAAQTTPCRTPPGTRELQALRASTPRTKGDAMARLMKMAHELRGQIAEVQLMQIFTLWGVDIWQRARFLSLAPHASMTLAGTPHFVWRVLPPVQRDGVDLCIRST